MRKTMFAVIISFLSTMLFLISFCTVQAKNSSAGKKMPKNAADQFKDKNKQNIKSVRGSEKENSNDFRGQAEGMSERSQEMVEIEFERAQNSSQRMNKQAQEMVENELKRVQNGTQEMSERAREMVKKVSEQAQNGSQYMSERARKEVKKISQELYGDNETRQGRKERHKPKPEMGN